MLPALPRPQAKALAVALLLEEADGSPPDQRAIALGFAGALRVLARSQPVAVAIDDLQWLDRPSAFVLEFTLRRLREDGIAFLLTLRHDGSTPAPFDLDRALGEERLRRLRVAPLSLGALHRLLSDRLDLVLSRPKLRRIHELSGGNPMFALELGRAVTRGAIRLEPAEPLPGTLASVVRDRLMLLPRDTRRRVARGVGRVASHPRAGGARRRRRGRRPARAGLRGARRRAGPGPASVSRIRCWPPASTPRRRPTSAAGCTAAWRSCFPIRRSTPGISRSGPRGRTRTSPTALERAARQAHDRGAFPAAAELSELARRLTPAAMEERRHRRTVDGAIFAWEAGETERATELLGEARSTAPRGPRRGEVLYWLGSFEEYEGDRRKAAEPVPRGS